jgi:uncharacterized membrane protein
MLDGIGPVHRLFVYGVVGLMLTFTVGVLILAVVAVFLALRTLLGWV